MTLGFSSACLPAWLLTHVAPITSFGQCQPNCWICKTPKKDSLTDGRFAEGVPLTPQREGHAAQPMLCFGGSRPSPWPFRINADLQIESQHADSSEEHSPCSAQGTEGVTLHARCVEEAAPVKGPEREPITSVGHFKKAELAHGVLCSPP